MSGIIKSNPGRRKDDALVIRYRDSSYSGIFNLKRMERESILLLLNKHPHDVATDILGLKMSTLQYKMHQHQIDYDYDKQAYVSALEVNHEFKVKI